MGYLRFYCRLSIICGRRLNVSKSRVSLSLGTRGAWWTIGPRGSRATEEPPETEMRTSSDA
jgi:hypothetical protein